MKNVKQVLLHILMTITIVIMCLFFYERIQNQDSYKELGKLNLQDNYTIIAGVIRNNGKGWRLIQDESHETIGIKGVTQDKETITVYYDEMSKVNSVAVTVDETMSGEGYHVGASVGLNKIVITIYDEFNEVVNPAKYVNNLGNIWIQGVFKQ